MLVVCKRDLYYCSKRDLLLWQKRPITAAAKEAYYCSSKRDLYYCSKRDLLLQQKRPITAAAKEYSCVS
jgi:hypothetical protein